MRILRIILNLFCEVLVCIELTRTTTILPLWDLPPTVHSVAHVLVALMAASFFWLMEAAVRFT